MSVTSANHSSRLATLATLMASIATLTACGGDGGSSTPPSPPPSSAPLTVSSATIVTKSYHALATLTVNGTGLDSGLSVTSTSCAGISRSTTSTSTVATFSCTPTAYSGNVVVSGPTGTLATATFSMPVPVVTASSVSATRYGAPVMLTLTGANLDAGLTVTEPGCKGLALSTTAPNVSSATTAYYTCTASGAYNSSFTVRGAYDESITTAALSVPVPVVTMAIAGDGVSGNLVITLRGDKAPTTVDNFLAYVNSHFYDGTIFHRVVPGFVVQAGGYTSATSGTLGSTKATTLSPIALETTGGSNLQWTVAMARTSVANSATSQFFVNLVNNASTLDPSGSSAGYAVFGDATASASLVQAIAAAPNCTLLTPVSGDGSCVPIPNIVITSATQTQ